MLLTGFVLELPPELIDHTVQWCKRLCWKDGVLSKTLPVEDLRLTRNEIRTIAFGKCSRICFSVIAGYFFLQTQQWTFSLAHNSLQTLLNLKVMWIKLIASSTYSITVCENSIHFTPAFVYCIPHLCYQMICIKQHNLFLICWL